MKSLLLALPALALAHQLELLTNTKYVVGDSVCDNNKSGLDWDCCFTVALTDTYKTNVCANMTVVPTQLVVNADLSVDGQVIIHESFPLVDPNYCETIPDAPVMSVCMGLENIQISYLNHSIYACAYVSVMAMGYAVAKYDLSCQYIDVPVSQMPSRETIRVIEDGIASHVISHPVHISPMAKIIARLATVLPRWAQISSAAFKL